ncbi:MAG: flagellar basal-body rod protein FlgF [Rhodospirillales bacterium]|nr:flagellar basal-body rod protein FlgF [Rhodospirillales bacterium]
METSTYIALSRQGGLQRQMDIVAHNIANMNTAGFKGQDMMFVEHLVKSRGGEKLLGNKLAYARDISTLINFSEGPMEKTGNPLDLAITGDGFFVVRTPQGERYTRNGRFKLDEGGQLVNQAGLPVLSSAGQPFILAPEDTEITVSRDGTVSTNNGNLGKLKLVRFENPQQLKRSAGSLYASESPPIDVEQPSITQGMLEGSNVQPIFEMAKMIDISRTYDNVRNFIEREDDRMRNMIREMARTA